MIKKIYTVTRRLGRNYDDRTPEIRIGGKWLSKAGINVGDKVELKVDDKLILISPAKDDKQIVTEPEETSGSKVPEPRFSPGMKVTDIVNSFLLPTTPV